MVHGRWKLGALGLAAVLLGGAGGAEAEDSPAPVFAADGAGTLRAFDAETAEEGCRTVGRGRPAGNGTVRYDAARGTLQYRIELDGAEPNTDYQLDVSECDDAGALIARGDSGNLHTDARGAGVLEGTWAVQTGTRWLRATLLASCADPHSPVPIVPCRPEGYASDALALDGSATTSVPGDRIEARP